MFVGASRNGIAQMPLRVREGSHHSVMPSIPNFPDIEHPHRADLVLVVPDRAADRAASTGGRIAEVGGQNRLTGRRDRDRVGRCLRLVQIGENPEEVGDLHRVVARSETEELIVAAGIGDDGGNDGARAVARVEGDTGEPRLPDILCAVAIQVEVDGVARAA